MKVYYAKLEFETEANEVLFYKGVISPLFSEREYAEQWGRKAMEKENPRVEFKIVTIDL